MKPKHFPHRLARLNPSRCLAAALALLLLLATGLHAAETYYYLAAGRLDPLALLTPPPLPGSGEQAGDLAEVRYVHDHHTTNEEAAAWVEDRGFSLANFAPAIGNSFQPGKLPKTRVFFQHAITDAERLVTLAKNHWMRDRPYVADPALDQGRPSSGYSYPSGHSTEAMTYALVLAEIFPDRQDALLAEGRDIGWHRVVIAKHYPTDVFAGRVLAQAVVRELNASPGFQHDLAEVKAEIAAAEAAQK